MATRPDVTKKATLEEWRTAFDKLHGVGAAQKFEKLLASRKVSFATIAMRFGVTKQRVSQIVGAHFKGYRREVIGTITTRS
jgi:hypothetical protein